ncbi:MAG TPA: methyltransferase domain-containing protein [Bdellovibrio sp.]|uniref:methyltransferase domain-containing protein n=1 Tax=Bdellovibrio sp. TaxID=28201 RepID=UPI002EEC1A36
MSKGTWNPSQYEKFKNERSQPFIDLMNMVHPIPNGKAIDLGCGTGELTQTLHKYLEAASTVGLDSSTEMLKESEKFSGDGVSFVMGDIKTWSEKEKYGVVFSNAAIQWCENHREIFQHLYDALVDGGQLAVQMPMNHDFPTHILSKQMSHEPRWKAALGGATYDKPDVMLSVEEYAKLLFKLGFREQTVTMKVYGHVLNSREEVIEWVKGSMLTHFRSHMSEDNYKEFLQEYRERLFQFLPDEKPFFYPFKRILLWAKK